MLHFTPHYKPSKAYMGGDNGRGDIRVSTRKASVYHLFLGSAPDI